MNALYFALKWKGFKSQFITISLGYVKDWSYFFKPNKKVEFLFNYLYWDGT